MKRGGPAGRPPGGARAAGGALRSGRAARAARVAAGLAVAAAWLAGIAAGSASARALGAAGLVASVQLIPSISAAASGLSGLAWAWLAILALTAAFGRIYCASICPMGTIQDAAAALGRRTGLSRLFRNGRRAAGLGQPASGLAAQAPLGADHRSGSGPDGGLPLARPRLSRKAFGLALAAVGVAGAAAAPAVLAWLEPYALATRLAASLAGSAWDGLGAAAASARLDLPSSPFRPDAAWAAAAAAPGLAVVLSSLLSGKRLFCSSLCPSGAILGIAASRSAFSVRIDAAACTSCGACARACGVGAADPAGKRIDSGACVACFDCVPACPTGAIAYGLRTGGRGRLWEAGPPAPASPSVQPGRLVSRREFMAAGTAGAAGLALAAIGVPAYGLALGGGAAAKVGLNGTRRLWAAPPGARSLSRYLRLCVSCGLCARSCPSGVLRQSASAWRPAAPLVPYMDYARGFCQFECVACGQACPTGAIEALGVEEKTVVAVAKSRLDLAKCIVVEKGTRCGACAEHCPTGAISMGAVPGAELPGPILARGLCIGCGACETVCPSEPSKALTVEGLSAHERASVLPARPGAGAQASGLGPGAGAANRAGDTEEAGDAASEPPGGEGFAF